MTTSLSDMQKLSRHALNQIRLCWDIYESTCMNRKRNKGQNRKQEASDCCSKSEL